MTVDNVQKEVLRTLDSFETPATQKAIRQELDLPKSTLSTKLSGLEDEGYVIDKSDFKQNSKQYVIAEDVELDTNYRFETFRDSQLAIYAGQTMFFVILSIAMVEVLEISTVASYIMYGSYILGIVPPLAVYLYETVSSNELLSIEVNKN